MTTTEVSRVLAVNAAFYRAMASGDLAAMDRLWSRRRPVTCTHPSGPAISGRAAVMESWRLILTTEPPAIVCTNPKAVVTGGSALVLCHEIIGRAELIASNAWVREDGGWRMINHQAAEVS